MRTVCVLQPALSPVDPTTIDTGAFVILVGVLCAVLRHVSTPQLRVTTIFLLSRFGIYTDDETRLQVCDIVVQDIPGTCVRYRTNCEATVVRRTRIFV